ncbi:hypothetical protein L3X37_10580 [Sabulilitoribacter arenilitoris]|uniref:Uncharacterized protein n=1 Tax=Wocania arenilitoris TaxID=2044858 RepID=A0AAE3ENQ1_9FLAO|nr:hypothetical protein [Wocania arenilitoris]MCF7568805.1 hypothetical protein [Wocania arenilitoris]
MKELSIDDLSDRLNLSKTRFKHRFKKEIEIPSGEFIMRNKSIMKKKTLATMIPFRI